MKYFTPVYKLGKNIRPPDLYEFSPDNFWFKAVGFENQTINEPLRGSHKADVVILGGGFSGLSAAYNIIKNFRIRRSCSWKVPAAVMVPAAGMVGSASLLPCWIGSRKITKKG